MSEIFTVCGSKHLYPHKVFGRLGHGPIWSSDQNTGDLLKKTVNIGIRMSHYKDPDEPTMISWFMSRLWVLLPLLKMAEAMNA